ncbi:hypothetical protein OSTOST_24978, partial [Ostertagia ostertagi]
PLWRCLVTSSEVCRSVEECENLTPPNCSHRKQEINFPHEPARLTRATDVGGKRGQIEVAATLTMEDTLDANTVTSEKELLVLENDQFTSVTSTLSQTICFPTSTILFSALLLFFVFITSTV